MPRPDRSRWSPQRSGKCGRRAGRDVTRCELQLLGMEDIARQSTAMLIQSHILNPVSYLMRIVNFPNQDETADDFSNASGALVAIGNTCVRRARGIKPKVVTIHGEK